MCQGCPIISQSILQSYATWSLGNSPLSFIIMELLVARRSRPRATRPHSSITGMEVRFPSVRVFTTAVAHNMRPEATFSLDKLPTQQRNFSIRSCVNPASWLQVSCNLLDRNMQFIASQVTCTQKVTRAVFPSTTVPAIIVAKTTNRLRVKALFKRVIK